MIVDFDSQEWVHASLPDKLVNRTWENARDMFQIQCEFAGVVVEIVDPDEYPEIYDQAMDEVKRKLDECPETAWYPFGTSNTQYTRGVRSFFDGVERVDRCFLVVAKAVTEKW